MNGMPVSQQKNLTTEQSALEKLAANILSQAKKLGASAAEVALNKDSGLITTVRMGEVETVEFNRDKGIDISVYFGQSKGVASTSDTSATAVSETLQAACDIAKATAADSYAGLADKSLMAESYPDLQLCYPWGIDVEQAIELAKECEDTARASDKRIVNSEGASLTTHHGLHVYGNSHGFIGSYPSSRHSLSCVLIAKQNGKMQRDYDYTVARDATKLLSPQRVAENAVQKTVQRLGARSIKTCQVPVLYSADIASGLLWHLIAAISGRNLYRRSSFLLDAVQQTIFPQRFHFVEDPLIISGLGSAPFDGEGVKTQKRDLIKEGKLLGYVLGSYSARKLGLQTTGNAGGIHNLIVKTDPLDFTAILQEMGTGLLLTDVMGHGVNITTGDYSQGAAGFWVENGEVQYPVEGITIAGNLRDMFQNIRAIANDIDTRHSVLTGSTLVDGMTIAGT